MCPGARALAVRGLLESSPAVVVVPGSRDAEELLFGLELLAPDLSVAALPAELAPVNPAQPAPLGAAAEAVAALLRIAEPGLRILIVPARLLPYPLPHPHELAARSLTLAPGSTIDTNSLAKVLLESGYRRVEVVEEAGEFAQRGQILDFGTPELFGRVLLNVDVVEEVRAFDPSSQRSTSQLPHALVPPLSLFGTAPAAARRVGTSVDGASPPSDGMLHAWDLLPHLVVCEREAVLLEVERWMLTLGRSGRNGDAGTSAPSAGRLLSPDECAAALEGADRVEELVLEDGTPWVRFGSTPTPRVAARPSALIEELRVGLAGRHTQVLVAATRGEGQRVAHLLTEADLPFAHGWPADGGIGIVEGRLAHGFRFLPGRLVVFGREDITSLPAPSRSRRSLASVLASMRDLKAGDFVVHAEHGIGRFLGIRTITFDSDAHEVVELEYSGGGKLLVPLERADVLEKHSGSEGAPPHLDRLGGSTWARTKARVKKAIRDMAEQLLKVQAQREIGDGFAFSKDSPWQREFEEAFEWELTPDQELATGEVKRDMESRRPMDRLLVGDVGYGKTEVAMRAAFKAVMDGKQVAVLAPTTILAEQHVRTFARRFTGFPIEIRWLSRFLAPVERRQVLTGARDGTVDVIIGTHRLLAKDVAFRDLGLVVVDEEQRFGVAQKERLKSLKSTVDMLALSATPIPRTLNLGLLGLRDVSIIETPPRDRLAVQTHVLPFRREVIREAVLTEIDRGGQVFFVHNRVASIDAIANFLHEIVPEATITVAHGQMEERRLERAMADFLDGRANVLLATAIVENGLDIPNANTLIISRADRFGLAELYQLRGRVGRSDRLAFAYLLVPPERSLSETARQRLAAILEFADLGAGFRVAARDLEIRGAGNILGAEQHGHLRAVGYETYCRLLEEAVSELRGEEAPRPPLKSELRLGLDLRLPEAYLPEETMRLVIYRRIAAAADDAELRAIEGELADRFGPPPPQLANLLLHQQLRRRAERCGVAVIRRAGATFELTFDPSHPSSHASALAILAAAPLATLTPAGLLRVPVDTMTPGGAGAGLLETLEAADRVP